MSQPAHGLAAVTEQVPATAIGSLSRRRDTHRGGGNLGSDNTAAPSDNITGQTDNTAPQRTTLKVLPCQRKKLG